MDQGESLKLVSFVAAITEWGGVQMADTVYRLTAKEGSSWWEGLCGWHRERKVIPNGIYTLNRMNYQV